MEHKQINLIELIEEVMKERDKEVHGLMKLTDDILIKELRVQAGKDICYIAELENKNTELRVALKDAEARAKKYKEKYERQIVHSQNLEAKAKERRDKLLEYQQYIDKYDY